MSLESKGFVLVEVLISIVLLAILIEIILHLLRLYL